MTVQDSAGQCSTVQCSAGQCLALHFNKSRSEQAPGSEFHPRDENEKMIVGFWDLLGAIKM